MPRDREFGSSSAGLSQVLGPLVDLLPELAAPQADAIAAALTWAPSVRSELLAIDLGGLFIEACR
jgi:hypothetical protein